MSRSKKYHKEKSEKKLFQVREMLSQICRDLPAQVCPGFTMGFPGGLDGKVSACNVGDLGSIPGSGRSPGEGNGNQLQNAHLENSMD